MLLLHHTNFMFLLCRSLLFLLHNEFVCSLGVFIRAHLADSISILWLQLASVADWCAENIAWFFGASSKCFWSASWWYIFVLWKMVSVLKDNTPTHNFWFPKWCKFYTGKGLILCVLLPLHDHLLDSAPPFSYLMVVAK